MPLDLRPYSGMQSLQIGYFDEQYGPDFRKTAEQVARSLRARGEEAYFYHGHFLSMVTIGLFTDADWVQKGQVSVYGPRILAVQERFPYNVGNSREALEEGSDAVEGAQESFLVRVP